MEIPVYFVSCSDDEMSDESSMDGNGPSVCEKSHTGKSEEQLMFQNSYDPELDKQIQKELKIQLHEDIFCHFLDSRRKKLQIVLITEKENRKKLKADHRVSNHVMRILKKYRLERQSILKDRETFSYLYKLYKALEESYRKKQESLVRLHELYEKYELHFDDLWCHIECCNKFAQYNDVKCKLESKMRDGQAFCTREAGSCSTKRVQMKMNANLYFLWCNQCYDRVMNVFNKELHLQAFWLRIKPLMIAQGLPVTMSLVTPG